MGSHEVEKLVDFKIIFFGMALQDQVLVKWKNWDREEDMTWKPRQKIDDMGDDWKHRVCVLDEAEYRARERLEQSVHVLRIERSGTAGRRRERGRRRGREP
eukprot:5374892-Pleurochrysis_carterae.AAC.2